MIIEYITQSLQRVLANYAPHIPLVYFYLILSSSLFALVSVISYLIIGSFVNLLLKRYTIQGVSKLKIRSSLLISTILLLKALPILALDSTSGILANIIWGFHFLAFILIILLTNQLIEIIFTILSSRQQKGYGNQLGILQILKSIAKVSSLSLVVILVPRFFVVYDLSKWLASFSIGAGTLTAIAALASKDLISNFFGALVILIGKPFKVGDWIIVNKLEGRVVSIDIRSTQLQTASGTYIYIPNGIFTSKHLENYGHVAAVPIHLTIPIISISQETLDSFLEDIQKLMKETSLLVNKNSRIYLSDINAKTAKVSFNLAFATTNPIDSIKNTRNFLEQVEAIAKKKKIDIQ